MLSTDSTPINVSSFEVESFQQNAFFDNISLTSGSVAPDTEKPSVPTGLGAMVISSSQIDLVWTASTDNVGVTGYNVYEGGSLIAPNVATTSFQHTNLAASTNYSYTVEAVDAAGNLSGQSSPPVVATTLAGSGTIIVVGPSAGPGIDFTSIQAAANVVDPGDTVIVKDGIYFGTSTFQTLKINRSGTAGNWITFKSEIKWGAILDGQSHSTKKGISFGSDVQYVRIENFEIRDYHDGGISLNQPDISNIYIYGNHLHGIGQINDPNLKASGIGTYKGTTEANAAQHITIDSNIIHDIGKLGSSGSGFVWDHGLYLRGRHHTVVNNILYNNKSGWSILLSDKGSYVDSDDKYDYIANNTIFSDNHEYKQGHSGGIMVRTSHVWIENNIITVPSNKQSVGGSINIFNVGAAEDNLYFKNNLTNANNIWTEHDRSRAHVAPDWPETELNNVETNIVGVSPATLFVGDIANMPSSNPADYHLKVGSTAIDAGKIPILPDLPGGLTYDYRHTAIRPQGSAYDIGAFEFVPPASLFASEGEETSEVSPATQGELFDVALAELIGSSRGEASPQLRYSPQRHMQVFNLEPSVELAERFVIEHRAGPVAPALRLSGDNNPASDLEPTAHDREEIFNSLFTEFEDLLTF